MVTIPRGTRDGFLANSSGGLLVGLLIGYVSVCLQFVEYTTECARFRDKDACDSLGSTSSCSWRALADPATGAVTASCAYEHWEANCSAFATHGACPSDHCYFDYKDEACKYTHGWNSVEEGSFAAMMIVGGMIGSVLASPSLKHLGRRRTILGLGVVGLVSALCMTLGWHWDSYAGLAFGRFVAGITVGGASVSCPMYVGEVVPPEHQGIIGVMFQIWCTFGIMLAAFVGLLADPRNETHGTHHIRQDFQALNGLCWLTAALVIAAALVIKESASWRGDGEDLRKAHTTETLRLVSENHRSVTGDAPGGDACAAVASLGQRLRRLWLPISVGLALSAAQQLTGINAVMNYAPSITAAFGLPPLTGNFVVMAWNFVTTLASLPLASRFTPRRVYVIAAFVASFACLFTAVPTYPGVLSNKDASHVLGGLGVVLFIAAFEIGMGPSFYILAQDIFPARDRSFGCSLIIWVQFVFNLIIAFGYPVAQTGMSGGPSGNQDKGQALCFAIFGIAGLVMTSYLFFCMPASPDADRHESVVLDDDGVSAIASEIEEA